MLIILAIICLLLTFMLVVLYDIKKKLVGLPSHVVELILSDVGTGIKAISKKLKEIKDDMERD